MWFNYGTCCGLGCAGAGISGGYLSLHAGNLVLAQARQGELEAASLSELGLDPNAAIK
jgi:F0F1-type ATP synthase membrane subunit c/vacuolar-type H+-ATPase subunit K